MRCERSGNRGEDAGLVGDVETDVIASNGFAHRADAQICVRRLAKSPRAGEPVARDVHEVAEHRTRSRGATGAAAVEHQLPCRFAFDEHCVVGVAHPGERMRARDHRRMHTDADTAAFALGDREKFDDTVHLLR